MLMARPLTAIRDIPAIGALIPAAGALIPAAGALIPAAGALIPAAGALNTFQGVFLARVAGSFDFVTTTQLHGL